MNNQPHWFYFYIMPLMPTVLTIAGWFFVVRREKSKRRLERKDRRIDAALTLLEKLKLMLCVIILLMMQIMHWQVPLSII